MNTLFWWTGLLAWAFWTGAGLMLCALWAYGKMMQARGAGSGVNRVANGGPPMGRPANAKGAAKTTVPCPAPAPVPLDLNSVYWREMAKQARFLKDLAGWNAIPPFRTVTRAQDYRPCVRYCTLDELMPTVVDDGD